MAGKSPAELKSEGEELKALFAKIKKKPHNCAILMSKDGVVVEAHVKKSADILVKAAKKKGGMAKGAWGVATMEGQVLILDPINEKVPGNLGKIAKKFFTERSLKLRLEIKEPDEEVSASAEETTEESSVSGGGEAAAPEEESSVSGGGEDASEDGESTSVSGGGEEEVDKRAELEARLEEVRDDIDELEKDTESVMHSALIDAMRAHERNMEAEEFDKAEESLKKLMTVLEDYEGLMVDKRPLMARMAKLESDAQKVVDGADPEATQGVEVARRAFVGAIENNEWFGAGEQLDKIEAYIDSADVGGGQKEERSPSDSQNEEESPETSENAAPATPEEESSVSGGDERSDQDDSTSVSGGESEEDSRRADMERRVAEIQSEIDELEADTGNVMHSSLIDALRRHEQAMTDEDYDRANDTFAKTQSVLADYESLVAEKRPLMQRMAKMEADAQKVISGDDPIAKEDIERAKRAYVGAIDNNEWFGAGEQLNNIEALIKAAGVSSGAEEETTDQAPETGQEPQSTSSSEEESAEDGDSAVREAAKAKRKTVIGKMLERLKTMNADLK